VHTVNIEKRAAILAAVEGHCKDGACSAIRSTRGGRGAICDSGSWERTRANTASSRRGCPAGWSRSRVPHAPRIFPWAAPSGNAPARPPQANALPRHLTGVVPWKLVQAPPPDWGRPL